jgi:cytochrome c-type biogenesis protein CcmH/NrfF
MSSEPVCEVSKKLLDLEQRSVIKFLTKEGNKTKEILERMVAVYGESAPSYYKVKFWSKQFKWGRESIVTLGVLWKRLLKKCARNWKI